MEKKNVINVRLSAEDSEMLNALSDTYNTSRSEVIRKLISDSNDRRPDIAGKQDGIRELSYLSNGINEVCRLLQNDNPELCRILIEGVDKLWQCF